MFVITSTACFAEYLDRVYTAVSHLQCTGLRDSDRRHYICGEYNWICKS